MRNVTHGSEWAQAVLTQARPVHAFSWTASPLTPRTAGAEIQPLRDLPPNPAAPLWPGFSCPL